MTRRWLLNSVLLATALAPSASARTWYILNDGSGDAPTVQAGIDSAAAGDTVLVGPGTYLENLSIIGKDLVLKSEMGSKATILDGSSQLETVIYLSGQTRAMVVEGFKITGGVGHVRSGEFQGGGLYLDSGSSPTIRGNEISRNGALGTTRGGGAVFTNTLFSSPISALFDGNLVESNEADLGGGIGVGPMGTEIKRNIFRGNTCVYDGGAIYSVYNSGTLTIEGNQFWGNSAGDHGGAIHIGGTNASQLRVAWNLFVRNRANGEGTGDTGSGGSIRIARVSGSIVNNTFVEGIGLGESVCGGGALSLEDTSPSIDISGNLFAFNRSCGISCRFGTLNTLGPNLFWMNQDGDLGTGSGLCPAEWTDSQILADPLFCGPEVGNYTVAINSPALTGPVPMGVWVTPGCGPGVPVQPTTWGRLKALYR